jgi:hypothetical protein
MAESDEHFLGCVLKALERLREASQNRGHPMLASMIDLAKAEAEDHMRTQALAFRHFSEFRARALTAEHPPSRHISNWSDGASECPNRPARLRSCAP